MPHLWGRLDPYPRARLDRVVAGGPDPENPFAEAVGVVPRVNHHPFLIAVTAVANRQRTIVFGPFIGAALIRDLQFGFTAGQSIDAHLGVRISPDQSKDGVEEARGVDVPGRLVTFGRQTGGTVGTPYDQGFELFTLTANPRNIVPPVMIPVRDERFFVKITLVAVAASTAGSGLLTVFDAIPQDRLADFF